MWTLASAGTSCACWTVDSLAYATYTSAIFLVDFTRAQCQSRDSQEGNTPRGRRQQVRVSEIHAQSRHVADVEPSCSSRQAQLNEVCPANKNTCKRILPATEPQPRNTTTILSALVLQNSTDIPTHLGAGGGHTSDFFVLGFPRYLLGYLLLFEAFLHHAYHTSPLILQAASRLVLPSQ